jgi:3-oxoadipate enol-lactonase
MYVRDAGHGPAVLLLHGSPSSPEHFAPLAEALASHRRVLVPDLPGYGRSPALEGTYTFAAVNELLERELLDRGIREFAVVGHSLGAYRALLLALARGSRVTQLVLLGAMLGPEPSERAAYRHFAALTRQPDVDIGAMLVPRMLSAEYVQAHPDGAKQVSEWGDIATRQTLAAELEAVADAEDLRPRLGELDVPILVRAGAIDLALPLACGELIAARARNARLEVVPGCGHVLLLEDPANTVASIVTWLR